MTSHRTDPHSSVAEMDKKVVSGGYEKRERVAIIVPFRDLHEEQKRKRHLEQFIPAMTAFLANSDVSTSTSELNH